MEWLEWPIIPASRRRFTQVMPMTARLRRPAGPADRPALASAAMFSPTLTFHLADADRSWPPFTIAASDIPAVPAIVFDRGAASLWSSPSRNMHHPLCILADSIPGIVSIPSPLCTIC
jgi:hypothetical protein